MYWNDYCRIHGDFIIIKDVKVPPNPSDPERALKTIPKCWLAVKPSQIDGQGVWSIRHIPKAIKFGPYEGDILEFPNNDNYCWKIKGASCFIDAGNPGVSNWMRYVNCARHISEQNLAAFQYRGQIYYRTLHEIKPNTELLVWYGASFAKRLGIDVKNYHIPLTPLMPSKLSICLFFFK